MMGKGELKCEKEVTADSNVFPPFSHLSSPACFIRALEIDLLVQLINERTK
jgi:hypothetical protein